MSGRVYVRKFDWDEARRLRKSGLIYKEIAARLGVSTSAVQLACNARTRAFSRMATAAYQRSGTCVDCGCRISRNRVKPAERCHACLGRAQTTSVRDDALKCFGCKEWKWDTEFPWNASLRSQHRRGRHSLCRSCQTVARRDYRQRNREKDNAYQRERRRKAMQATTGDA